MSRIVFLLACLCLSACEEATDSLRIGANRWPGYAPIYLADELNWLAPSGLHLVEYPSASGVSRGFQNGLLDAAFLTLDEALKLQSAGRDVEIILVTDIAAGANALFAAAPAVTVGDLRGRRIGVENSAVGVVFLEQMLGQAGLTCDDVQVVKLPMDEHVPAMRTGRVDAVITFTAAEVELSELGARRIFDNRNRHIEILDVLVVDRSRVDPAQRQRLKALWFESLALWQENPGVLDGALYKRLGLAPWELKVSLSGLALGDAELNRQLEKSGRLRGNIEDLGRYMARHQLLEEPVNATHLLHGCGSGKC